MRTKSNPSSDRLRRLRPTPALIIAFVALFAAMGGVGYATGKLKPLSVKAKNIKSGAVTTAKIADGAVTTPKLAPDAVAPYATNAANAMNAANATNAANAAKLGGVAPGGCQQGWLKASMTVDTAPLNGTIGEPVAVPGFNCASAADDAVQVQREAIGQYTVTLADSDANVAIASSAGSNSVSAATSLEPGSFLVKVWNNSDAAFVDGRTFTLIAF
jgi:hypothetical protein